MLGKRLHVQVTVVAILLSGCAARIMITPQIEPSQNVSFHLQGRIIYDGNQEYLPTTITGTPVAQSALTLRYSYDVVHGKDNVPQLLPLFNPLTIVGFPIGEDTLVVRGQLEISKEDEVLKTYTATCGLESTRNVFWPGETYSELRRKGLLAVRENIETQMQRDRELLSKLSAAE